MINFKGMELKVIEATANVNGEETVLCEKPNGNYTVLTRDSHNATYNSFARSFKTLEQAKNILKKLHKSV